MRQHRYEGSRKRGLEALALVKLQVSDPDGPRDEPSGRLTVALSDGQAQHVGRSEVTVDEIEAARKVVPIATVQNLYNLADRKSEAVLEYCEANNLGFIPWFPLAAGSLADPGGPLATAAKTHGVAPGAVALAWLLHRSPVMLPIPGTSSVAHLEENMTGGALALSAEELEALSWCLGCNTVRARFWTLNSCGVRKGAPRPARARPR